MVCFAEKVQMTQIFDKSGMQKAVTVLRLKKTQVCGKRNTENDSYNAGIFAWIDEGYKPSRSREKMFKVGPARMIKEQRSEAESADEIGKEIGISDFKVGEKVSVDSASKGKGFAGTVKRHGFATGPKTHGSSNWRKPGSIGPTYPQRTIKGRRMAGHMGAKKSSVKNLEIVAVRENENEIWVGGSVPGANKSIVVIRR